MQHKFLIMLVPFQIYCHQYNLDFKYLSSLTLNYPTYSGEVEYEVKPSLGESYFLEQA